MQTVLVEVNGSDAAADAVRVAADLAAAFGARLVAVSLMDGDPAHADAVRALQVTLSALGRELGLDVDVRSLHRFSGDELARQAREVRADVVVVGAPGVPGTPLGETTQHILDARVAPVLVVPAVTAGTGAS
jgi:nucleotide-binding universal stress UspA family protein